ncbi:MAG: hypothetical protein U1F76_16415 [Candidatus Competibacteraceae bacterium]
MNELSLSPPAPNVDIGKERIETLLKTVKEAVRMGAYRILRMREDIHGMELSPGYTVAKWRNDPDVDKEMQRYFKSLTTKVPMLTDEDGDNLRERHEISEFSFRELGGVIAQGLGVAFMLDMLAISLDSHSCWDSSFLRLEVSYLSEDGALIEESEVVRHAVRLDHVIAHRQWIIRRIKESISDGSTLWQKCSCLFPKLSFCDGVKRQLSMLRKGDPLLAAVIKRLRELEEYTQGWLSGPFMPEKIPCKVSPDSDPTMRQYEAERTFRCPDGKERIFTWHIRVTPGAWRIYFFPEDKQRTMIIGYIGKKPPSVKDPS